MDSNVRVGAVGTEGKRSYKNDWVLLRKIAGGVADS